MSKRRARIGVAGLGRMGQVHAANLAYHCAAAELGALFDAKAEVAGHLAEKLGVRSVPNFDDLLDEPSLDAVVISVPTGAHAELAVRAAKAGKHIFCEKPISLSRNETEAVLQAVAGTGVALQVGFHRRFDPATAEVAARVRAGHAGEVRLLRASQRDMRPPPPEFLAGSGGIFVDMGIHDFDLARWLVGEVDCVSAYGYPHGGPEFETAAVVLEFAGGALGLLDISRAAGYGYESSLELMGTKATARVEEPFRQRYQWLAAGVSERALATTFDQRFAEAFRSELEAFAAAVNEGREPLAGGHDALAAFDLARAAQASAESGGKRVRTSGEDADALGVRGAQ